MTPHFQLARRALAWLNAAMRRALLILLLCLSGLAPGRQDPAPVKKAVENFLHIQTKGLPGQVSYAVGSVDANNQLAPCPSLEVALPPGARLWGRSQVTVRCQAEGGWNLFVPVHIKVSGDYLVAARALGQGQLLQETDLARQSGDLTDLPAGILTDPRQAIGRTLTMPIPAGRPLRGDMLKQTTVVQQNQNVKVVSRGAGFAVSNEGRALTNAIEGQVVQVRLGNGQIVSGIARPGGVVEVSF